MVKKAGARRKKAEKSKTQLKKKQTFKVKPPQNILDATLVTKKLVLPAQLTDLTDQGIPLTKRKQSFKDCLIKLGHYSLQNRCEAIEGLKELCNNYPEMLHEYLSTFIDKLSPLTGDREYKVRQMAVEVLGEILNQASKVKLEPLYPNLMAHLGCALSHIDKDVRKDSMNLLDTLIDNVPGFVLSHYKQLLPNILDQISSTKHGAGSQKLSNTTGVGDKITIIQWRTRVLKRLRKILKIIKSSLKVTREEPLKFKFDNEDPYVLGQMKSGGDILNPMRPDINNTQETLSISSLVDNPSSSNENSFLFQNFANNVTSLLIETVTEVILPNEDAKKSNHHHNSNLVRSDAVELLEIVAESIKIILILLKNNLDEKMDHDEDDENSTMSKFRSLFTDKIIKNMMSHFPYSLLISNSKIRRNRNKMDVSEDANRDLENLNNHLHSIYINLLGKDITDNDPIMKSINMYTNDNYSS